MGEKAGGRCSKSERLGQEDPEGQVHWGKAPGSELFRRAMMVAVCSIHDLI